MEIKLTKYQSDILVLPEENLTPLKWKLGRVTGVIKGKDEKVRVAEVFHKKVFSRFCQICLSEWKELIKNKYKNTVHKTQKKFVNIRKN